MNLPCPLVGSDLGSGVRIAGRPDKEGSRIRTDAKANTHPKKVEEKKQLFM